LSGESLSTHAPSATHESLPPSSESSQGGGDDVDTKTAAFRASLLGVAYKLEGDRSFFNILGNVINMGVDLSGTLVNLAPVALNLLSNVIRQESETDDANDNDGGAYEKEQKAHQLELTGFASRALLAETALCALMDVDQKGLEEKGFFDFVKKAMQKVGGAVLANVPRMIDAAVSVVKSLLQVEILLGSNNDGDSDSTDDDEPFGQAVMKKHGAVASEAGQQGGNFVKRVRTNSHARSHTSHPLALSTDFWHRLRIYGGRRRRWLRWPLKPPPAMTTSLERLARVISAMRISTRAERRGKVC
jgi:hypothetical protein